MSDYILGDDAVLDLEDVWEYVARDSVEAADGWIAKLFEAFEMVARAPGIGHKREDWTNYPVLFSTAGAYLIIYRATPGQSVEIVAVTQGSRDIPAFLRQRFQ